MNAHVIEALIAARHRNDMDLLDKRIPHAVWQIRQDANRQALRREIALQLG